MHINKLRAALKTWHRLIGLSVFLLVAGNLRAQLSPGDLSKAHAELEGISNCTKCHVLGQKVSNDKCLDCHKELKSRVVQNKGFHVSKEVKGKACASCHNEHHGRTFDLVRLDEDKFEHQLTGYELTGAHKKTECRECHKADYVSDITLKKKKTTFLGLKQSCGSCHEDVHQKTLSTNDCAKCHTTEDFKPASRFDHNRAKFALKGKHIEVDCIKCHKKELRNGKEFQHFTKIAFDNCSSCHDDTHRGQLGTNCKECHVEEAFTSQRGLSRFNHNNTVFPLKGKHKNVDCAKCHTLQGMTPLTVFQDKNGIPTTACAQCHEDKHQGKLGNNCAECHTENSFQKVNDLDNFNHARTDFPLLGKHVSVDCKECHKTANYTDPLPHNTCASCHEDHHEGQFTRANGVTPDCSVCHHTDGFETSLYTLEMHSQTKFPLTGAHEATPCFACHRKEEKWVFRDIKQRCVDCHDDIHIGEIPTKYYPEQTCETCHATSSWKESQFNHNLTPFPLHGAHQKQACSACHLPDIIHPYGQFSGLHNRCADCHEDNHNRQFEQKGQTDCKRCHSEENWKIPRFNHNKTAFSLEGKHAKVACDACHKPVVIADKTIIQYKFKRFKCEDCHQ